MNTYKKWYWPLLIPSLILFLLVIIWPFILGVANSFSMWRATFYVNPETGTRAKGFFDSLVGFKNYVAAFSDQRFVHSIYYTFLYTIIAVISINVISLALALLVTNVSRGTSAYRTIAFLPNMLGGLALGFIWQFVFQIVFTDILFGPNGLISISALTYMTQNSTKALFAMAILNTWQVGGYMMIIYIAGLNNISHDYYEAASIDGAKPAYTFFKITIPMLMPAFTIVLFMTIANSFKMLDQNIALTNGEFNTRLLAMQLLRTVKDTSPPDYGMAQAQAVIFFIIIAAITITQVRITSKRELEL